MENINKRDEQGRMQGFWRNVSSLFINERYYLNGKRINYSVRYEKKYLFVYDMFFHEIF